MQFARTDDALSSIRARLAQLEACAEARRAKDQVLDAEPAPAPAELPLRDAGAAWMAAQGRDWKAEALADLDAIKPSSKPARFGTAPEYRAEVEAQESAAPVSTVGGHSDATGTEPVVDGVGAPAGNPEGSNGVGTAPQSEQGAQPPGSLARVPGSTPGRRAYPKQPQATAREDWRARWERIEAHCLRASLAPVEPIRGPFDGLDLRAGAGPPP